MARFIRTDFDILPIGKSSICQTVSDHDEFKNFLEWKAPANESTAGVTSPSDSDMCLRMNRLQRFAIAAYMWHIVCGMMLRRWFRLGLRNKIGESANQENQFVRSISRVVPIRNS